MPSPPCAYRAAARCDWSLSGARATPVAVRYEEPLFRPPSEADSLIIQATVGCSWNHCTYCGMYRHKVYRARPVSELVSEVAEAGRQLGGEVRRIFVADGDALAMPLGTWEPLLLACRAAFPRLTRISAYATARNVLEKGDAELARLRELGLRLLYLGPESGDDPTLKAVAKGATFDDHVRAAERLTRAGIEQSLMFLLGVGGTERSREHAEASAALTTAMNPRHASLLTLTMVPGTPQVKLASQGRFRLPSPSEMLAEARLYVSLAAPTNCVFRCNHASNYLPLGGRLPRDREALLAVFDEALAGRVRLRPEWSRGL